MRQPPGIIKTMFANDTIRDIIIFLAVLFFSTALHELMHALVAYKLGDDLAHSHGRISLNPLVHIDPFLTILLPLVMLLMGMAPIIAAKPVPVNTMRLKGGDMGMALVGVAGPLTNLVLAIIAGGVLRYTALGTLYFDIVRTFFDLNLILFVFNMIPLPPLDGSRVLYAFAPEPVQKVMEQIEGFGIFGLIIIITVFSPVLSPIIGSIEEHLARIILGS